MSAHLSSGSRRRVEARIERKRLLNDVGKEPFGVFDVKNDVPAVLGYDARDNQPQMLGKQPVPMRLLTSTRLPGKEPVWVRQIVRSDHVQALRLSDSCMREHVRHRVESPERLVDRNLKDGGRGVERGIDDAPAARVPTPTDEKAALAATPGLGMARVVESPEDNLAIAEGRGQRRHAKTPYSILVR